MVKMGLKEIDTSERRWSHPPKKKWIYNYLADDEEGGEEAATEDGVKTEVEYRGRQTSVETYPRAASVTSTTTNTTTHQHHNHHHHQHNHNHHRYHHHHNTTTNNHGGGGGVIGVSPPPAPRTGTTTPSSPAHARDEGLQQAAGARRMHSVTPPSVSVVSGSPGVRGALGVTATHHQVQQTSPKTPVSYPGSPASSPPHLATVTPRGGTASPLGLVSAFRQESPSPPTSGGESGVTRLAHEALHAHSHLSNGLLRHNGLTKPLSSLTPPAHNAFTHHALYSPEDPAFKDDKKRYGSVQPSPPSVAQSTPSREVHNKLEKNRRAHLKECFEALRRQLPNMDDKKVSNQTILKAAHRHIQNLKRKEREYEHEMERLAREKIAHQQKLSALKKELSARWDHIDFNTLLPDMASLEQHRDKETKSTTTASEQPDIDEDAARDAGTQATAVTVPCAMSPRVQGSQAQGTNFTTIATTANNGLGSTVGLPAHRDQFTDPNQPLNLSTSTCIVDTSARASPLTQQMVSQGVSPRHNGEWGSRQASPQYTQAHYTCASNEEDGWSSSSVSTLAPSVTGESVTSVPSEQLPIMGSTGIQLPAQLVAGGMQLNGAPGGLLGQPAIQVITPEGYKLLPADHAPNGAKPLTITLAHPGAEGLDRAEGGEEVKTNGGAMMVALNKNGVSALHLAVPTTARSLSHSQGTNGTVTTVPLNLSVGGTATVKVTSAATSILPSYLPITHANGITQLVSGLGSNMGTLVSGLGTPLVTPLVVSQPQRAVVPGNATTAGSKSVKANAVGGTATGVPLVPAQYASSLAGGALGGLVKPVVVVSAPAAVAGMVAGAHTVASGKP